MSKWTPKDLELLHRYYSRMGKMWCAAALGRSEASIRQKTFELGLRLDPDSEFAKNYRRKAAEAKIGKKRPEQALVMKRLHAEGKLIKNEAARKKISEAKKKWFAENPHPKGMLGKKHSQDVLEKISKASKENFAKMPEDAKYQKVKKMIQTKSRKGNLVVNRQKTTWKGGWRDIGGNNKFYRSRWEANYARFLEWLKSQGKIRSWKHEPKTFWFEGIKRGCVSYLPDFWVEEIDGSDSFHEVKGWMDDRSKTKIKRMAKYYPDVKLIVVAAKEYKTIEDNFSSLIEGWEKKHE